MADVWRVGRLLRKATDGHDAAATRDTFEEEGRGLDLVAWGPPIRIRPRRLVRGGGGGGGAGVGGGPPIRIRPMRLVRMCGDDVPEQHVVLDAELAEDAMND